MLAFIASHEACRRIAVFSIQLTRNPCQTGEPWHLLCHGGKTPANRLPLERPRALWARFGVQGHCPWGVAHETADGYVAADDHP